MFQKFKIRNVTADDWNLLKGYNKIDSFGIPNT